MSDILQSINDAVKDALEKQADEEIEKLVQEFRGRLNKRRAEIVGELISNLEILCSNSDFSNTATIQVNIRSNNNDR